MPEDKYTATWVSHSSISDFLICPRAYYLKNVYKDPTSRHKIQIVKPPLVLGQAVHAVLESLSSLPKDKRFLNPLPKLFEGEWEKVSGKRGGFISEKQEQQYKARGRKMIQNVYNHPGPLEGLAVKIKQDLPFFWLSEEDNIILCGKIDWLEYLPDIDGVHIIDFKTGKSREDPESLQLPIYRLLVENCQERKAVRASYWYLEQSQIPQEKELPELDESTKRVLTIAKKIKLARQLEKFDCPSGEGGCFACRPFERVLAGEGELIGQDGYNRDTYILSDEKQDEPEMESEIL